MNRNVRVLYKKQGQVPQIKFITDMLEIKKHIVKGDLKLVKFENCIIVCNKDGVNKNAIPNIVLDFKNICGDFFLIGYNPKEKDFRSLEIDEAMFYIDSLQNKSFHYKEYSKWKKKQKNKDRKSSNYFTDYQESQKQLAKKLNADAESTNNFNTEIVEMILGIQAMIFRYIRGKKDGE